MNPIASAPRSFHKSRLLKKRLCSKTRKKSKYTRNLGKKPVSKGFGTGHGARLCPKCGSKRVLWASGLPHLWSFWECRSCGYRGALIVRDESVRQTRARMKKNGRYFDLLLPVRTLTQNR